MKPMTSSQSSAPPTGVALMACSAPVRSACAAILFAITWIINATGTVTNAWFSVTGLLLIGLACWPCIKPASGVPGSGAASVPAGVTGN